MASLPHAACAQGEQAPPAVQPITEVWDRRRAPSPQEATVSGPHAEFTPLTAMRAGRRLYAGLDPLLWPLGVDLGVADSGSAWAVLSCRQPDCGATLLEVKAEQVQQDDWPVTLAEILSAVNEHAVSCEAFRA
jgi:hypothetical protein